MALCSFQNNEIFNHSKMIFNITDLTTQLIRSMRLQLQFFMGECELELQLKNGCTRHS